MTRRRRSITFLAALVLAGCTSSPSGPSGPARIPGQALGFRDVAAEVGLDFRQGAYRWDHSPDVGAMLGGGLCWLDYDDDGWMDLFVVNSYSRGDVARWEGEGGLPRSALFHNVGGRFVDVSAGSGADVQLRGNGCVAADLDLDGRTDLYVTGSDRGALLWNAGNGRFVDGTDAAGVPSFGWYAGAAVGDVDGDGWPDLFVAGYANLSAPIATDLGFPSSYGGVRDLLYLSEGRPDDGRVRFHEVGVDAGLEAVGFEPGLGATFSDFDTDGDLDLYVANDMKPNRLYDNVEWPGGPGADPPGLGFRFEELAGKAGVADAGAGMGVAVADDGNDGFEDIFVANGRSQTDALYRGQPSDLVDPSFVDVRSEIGVDLGGSPGWGVSWSDFDLDTDTDLLLVEGEIPVRDLAEDAQPLAFFENRSAQGSMGSYEDASGITDGVRIVGRGSATADYDNDGDLDVAVSSIGGSLILLQNTGTDGTWLEVALPVFSPGARVTAELSDGRVLVRSVAAGGSYLSTDDPRLHFGLGDRTSVKTLTVIWPDGQETVLRDVAAGQIVEVAA